MIYQDVKKNQRVLRSIQNIPDDRNLLARIFLQRKFREEELKSQLNKEGISIDSLEGAVFNISHDGEWRTDYTFDSIEPPIYRKETAKSFKFLKVKDNYVLSIDEYPLRKTKIEKRPSNQNIIKTKSLEELSELIARGFSIRSEEEQTFTSYAPFSECCEPIRTIETVYTLVRSKRSK